MARLEDKIAEIKDPALRQIIDEEVKALKEHKTFGLVFEAHQPEVVPLSNAKVTAREIVAKRDKLTETYRVERVRDGLAELVSHADDSRETVPVESLVVVRRMGDPIYPALTPIDSIKNTDPQTPHHILIEADNYHALQLLGYLYAGKVDCIYIDPPYNTGARDWKYNNDYVDSNDTWRHSKWLTFIEKRLILAKRLLKPDTGVLIVTIDEHEVHHLGMLLERVFPDAYVQMATIVINQKGVSQGRLARAEEYALFVFMPNAYLKTHHDDLLSPDRSNQKRFQTPRWEWLLRGGSNSRREDRPKLFYPIYVNPIRKALMGVGEPLPLEQIPDLDAFPEGTIAWPIRTDGTYGNWQVNPPSFKELIDQGFAKLGGYDKNRKTWTVLYLNRGTRKRIENGEINIVGRDETTGSVQIEYSSSESRLRNIKTVWHRGTHDSGIYGSSVLRSILGGESKFSFPKSIYAVRDAIASVVRDRQNALIVDFFAGSGTTLNAVNLLNAIDSGQRQCVLVTNNEVSEAETNELKSRGLQPGDDDYEAMGICRSVTWPRSKYTIQGFRDAPLAPKNPIVGAGHAREDSPSIAEDSRAWPAPTGEVGEKIPLPGEYLTGRTKPKEKRRTIQQLGFAEGRNLTLAQRKQLVSLIPAVPQSKLEADTPWFLADDCPVSILWDVQHAENWLDALAEADQITAVYVVTAENKLFKTLKEQVEDTLGPLLVEEEEKRPLSAGFPANLDYFKLDFLQPTEVQMGRQFAAILPILWMMAGAKGKRPEPSAPSAPWLIPHDCPFAVLMHEKRFCEFRAKIDGRTDLTHIFLVTNSDSAFHDMRGELPKTTQAVQLYKSYLNNFKINVPRQ